MISIRKVNLVKRPGGEVFSHVGRAISDWSMFQKGDRVLLGISGGKDSLLMAWALADILRRSPVKFHMEAVTVDPGEPSAFTSEDIENISRFMKSLDIPYSVESSHIAKIVEVYPTKKTACSLCANLRRGALCRIARQRGFNKLALAHHLDDAIETFFLNMFYQGSLRCFQPVTYLSRQQVTVVRPLVYLEEQTVIRAAGKLKLPVVPARCPVSGTTRRQEMKNAISDLSSHIPGFRNQMRGALIHLWQLRSDSLTPEISEISKGESNSTL